MSDGTIEQIHLTIYGTVQGVGFRPFIYRLAKELSLSGWVKNTGCGVEVALSGDGAVLTQFKDDLITKKPLGAFISSINEKKISYFDEKANGFIIKESDSNTQGSFPLLPDSALCDLCREELYDSSSRRYRYPFIHCCACGPRFSLMEAMPFDRNNTSMRDFPPCIDCKAEYEDPLNRRFFSQTTCCPSCGPTLSLLDSKGSEVAQGQEAISCAKQALLEGKIIAVKNTAGFLLLGSAQNRDTIFRLRYGKKRDKKPFAILVADVDHAREFGKISPAEIQALQSKEAPIVLVRKKEGAALAEGVCEKSPYAGLMLPHSALLTMLMEIRTPLVATSGNSSDEPLCIETEEALNTLRDCADLLLAHNRRIIRRLDDSVTFVIDGELMPIRRARGFIPSHFTLPKDIFSFQNLLSFGAELKNTFAFSQGEDVFVSQHMGSLTTKQSCDNYLREIKSVEKLFAFHPEIALCDMHPGYFSAQQAKDLHAKVEMIPHHRAHVYALMLERNFFSPFVAICWDGTGLGEDGTLWGAESFIFDGKQMKHFCSMQPILLPGGQKAIKEPRRAALGLLYALYGDDIPTFWMQRLTEMFSAYELSLLMQQMQKGSGAMRCSSIGRLFDAVSALLGLCYESRYEGHGALCLEAECYKIAGAKSPYPIAVAENSGLYKIETRTMIECLTEDVKNGKSSAFVARRFISTLSHLIVKIARLSLHKTVLLTGGVMQNRLLVQESIELLKNSDFTPIIHRRLPPNDGNISAGQILGFYLENKRGQ